jgi:hypothetical protein
MKFKIIILLTLMFLGNAQAATWENWLLAGYY